MTPQSDAIPPLLRGLIDDAAVFPPGNAPLPAALDGHRVYRAAWYEPLVGPLLLPVGLLGSLDTDDAPLRLGLIADTGAAAVSAAIAALPEGVAATHVEARVAGPSGLESLIDSAKDWDLPAFAEIPLSEPNAALDRLAGTGITPKFRTGGLEAELFPSPALLAGGLVACAERGLRLKLTAGLHHAVRHTDPSTGFTHHGFVNVLAAALAADAGDGIETVTDMLATTESAPLLDRVRDALDLERPLLVGFGSCSITEPLDDLIELSLVRKEN